MIPAPGSTCGLDTLKRDAAGFDAMYEKSLRDGQAVKARLGSHAAGAE